MKQTLIGFGATLALCLAAIQTAAAQTVEYVVVQKVLDDNAIVVGANGSTYFIEKGVGCLSLWRYEGKRVIINSPGLSLGVGSTLILPDGDQQCRIWNSQLMSSPGNPAPPTGTGNPAASPAAPRLSLKGMMSPAGFEAAGLSKLASTELALLDQWITKLASAAATLGQGAPTTGQGTPATYEVQASVNDSKFIINGKLFEAQTYCFGVEKGDRVIFITGSALGACAWAEFIDTRTNKSCKVWCK